MEKIASLWREVLRANRRQQQVGLVVLSKERRSVRMAYYAIDTLLYTLPYVLIGMALGSLPVTILLFAISGGFCAQQWRDVEHSIPEAQRQAQTFAGGTCD